MDEKEYGVHASHCCVIHGCKYGDDDCPVLEEKVEQLYRCEICDEMGFKNLEQVKELLFWRDEIKKQKEQGHEKVLMDISFIERLVNRSF